MKTENRSDWHATGDFDGANESPDFSYQDAYVDADLADFNGIRDMLRTSQENTYTPEIGSEADEQAQRLVKRGFLKPGPLGGYMIARFF